MSLRRLLEVWGVVVWSETDDTLRHCRYWHPAGEPPSPALEDGVQGTVDRLGYGARVIAGHGYLEAAPPC